MGWRVRNISRLVVTQRLLTDSTPQTLVTHRTLTKEQVRWPAIPSTQMKRKRLFLKIFSFSRGGCESSFLQLSTLHWLSLSPAVPERLISTYPRVWCLIPQLYLSSLFPQFNEGITRARECRVAKPRAARAAAWEEKRENLFFRASLVSRLQSHLWSFSCLERFARRTKGLFALFKLQLHVPRQEALLKFWPNPGLSLNIFRGTEPQCLSFAFCWAKWIPFVGASLALPPATRPSHLIAPHKSRFSYACYLRYNIQILKGSVNFSSIFFSNLAYTHLVWNRVWF